MKQDFVHLRVHSEYSLSDGIVRIKPLVAACVDKNMPAVGLSDRNNLFALVKFYNAAESVGVKPIIASDIWVIGENTNEEATPLVLIARNNEGYRNLCELLSKAYSDGQVMGVAGLKRSWIAEKSAGLLALSAGREGDVGRALLSGNTEEAKRRASRWQEMFPDAFYMELHRTGRENEEHYNALAVGLALDINCPVVATNDVRFLKREEFEAHEVRVCIHDGRTLDDPRRELRYSEQQYLKSAEEMIALFEDIPEALENTVEIAKRCNVTPDLGNYYLPEYPVPEGIEKEAFLSQVSYDGLEDRIGKILDPESESYADLRKSYVDRLEYELGVINSMGFPGYFLIVMEFIQWAKDNDIPVGPGRGSGAGSLVAYALKITDIDPLEYDLLFERFLNPERVSLPDFDIDFCMDGRDRVIQHVTERYGREAVSQIITFGTMAAKAVVRDVARVQGKPYGLADKLSKLIPFEPGMTLTRALEDEPLLKDFVNTSEEAGEIMEMAFKLEGLARNVGRHAGGVVIAPTKLTDFSPTYCDDSGGGLMTQFDMVDVEQAGLVKFDFLGLRTLTIIDNALKSINRRRASQDEAPVDLDEIELEDVQIYNDLKQAKTTAVFQLESRGMKDLMKKVKPNRFADIVALVALFRPGPMQLADDFINRKHGREEVDYLHPSLKHVLEDTYGVMLYQEQVMQIAQILAGYTLADADLLRRAMGKKKPEEMAKQRAVFLEGALKNDVGNDQANHIFNFMEMFAGYGFNKPHSVAYALIAYQTAWLKHYYPADFMAAVLSADMQNTDKVVTNIEECREMSLEMSPPDVNRGEFRFIAEDEQTIVYGLGAIKGLGEGPIESLVNGRQEGTYRDLYDFCERVDQRKVNKRAIEALVGSGAFDQLVSDIPPDTEDPIGYKRALLNANQEDAVGLAEQKSRNEDSGLTDLFGSEVLVSESNGHRYNHCEGLRPWSFRARLNREKESLGLFLTGHLVDEYLEEFKHFVDCRISQVRTGQSTVMVGGLVFAVRSMKSKRGGTNAFMTLDDKSGRLEIGIFGELYDQVRDKLKKDEIVFVKGSVEDDDFTGGKRMRATEVLLLEEARTRKASQINVEVNSGRLMDGFIDELAGILKPFRPNSSVGCPVAIKVVSEASQGDVILGDEWRVIPHDDLLQSLREHYGTEKVNLLYG
ncbi:MAG: DNA polymerase-3 subunit alpha [Candidatus Azotimanducaceae bacterium]|jgi:DNA polymerase-3 subunit alpha